MGDADSSCGDELEDQIRPTENECELDSPAELPTPEPTQRATSCQNIAVATLQEEVIALRAEIAILQAQLSQFRNQGGQSSHHGHLGSSDSPKRDLKVNIKYYF